MNSLKIYIFLIFVILFNIIFISCKTSHIDIVNDFKAFNKNLLFFILNNIVELEFTGNNKPILFYQNPVFAEGIYVDLSTNDNLELRKNYNLMAISINFDKSALYHEEDIYNIINIHHIQDLYLDSSKSILKYQIFAITRNNGMKKIIVLFISAYDKHFELDSYYTLDIDGYFLEKIFPGVE